MDSVRLTCFLIFAFCGFANFCLRREVESYPEGAGSVLQLAMNTAIYIYTLMEIALFLGMLWKVGIRLYDPLWLPWAAFAFARGVGVIYAYLLGTHIVIRTLFCGCLVIGAAFTLVVTFKFLMP